MINKLHELFVPKHFYNGLSKADYILYYSRTKLLMILGVLIFFLELALFIYYYFFSGIFNNSHFILIAVSALILFGLFHLKKTGEIYFLSWLAFFGFLFFQPMRAYYTGGANAINYSWFMSGVILIGAIHKRKTWLVFALVSLLQLIALHYFDGPAVINTIEAKLMTRITAYVVTFFTMWSVFSRDKFIVEETTKLKKIEHSNAMISAFSHEIRNPLTIGLGSIQILEQEHNNEQLKSVKNSFVRIQNVMDKISEIKQNQTLNTEMESNGMLDLNSIEIRKED